MRKKTFFRIYLLVLVCIPGETFKQEEVQHRKAKFEIPSMKKNKKLMKYNPSEINLDEEQSLLNLQARNSTDIGTNNKKWSRCHKCVQSRIVSCYNKNCTDTVYSEEKVCKIKRCKRKLRGQEGFHILQPFRISSSFLKYGITHEWSKWSRWRPCSANCRTSRYRICRNPGMCLHNIQTQTAFCYHEHSRCEEVITNMMNQDNEDNIQYSYSKKPKRKRRCGRPSRKSKMLKIIGGVESRKYKWPWHVAIINYRSEVFCGGTLIAARWVLTASHCLRKYLRVRLNEHNLRARDGRELELVVRKMFVHPRFSSETVDNDIALLLLPRKVRTPIACLPDKKPVPSTVCSVMGWGKLRPSDRYGTNILREAKIPIIDNSICKKSYRHFLITSNMICAGWYSGKSDTCAGDSGGGLMCHNKKHYSVQGITSFGDGCGKINKFGIYTSVFNYIQWIYFIMEKYS